MPNPSQSLIQIGQAALPDIFKTRVTVDPALSYLPVSAVNIMARQNANLNPIKDAQGKCVGIEVYYPLSSNDTLPAFASSAIASTCQIGTGRTVQTKKATYNFNFFSKPIFQMNDNDCADLFKAGQEMAYGLAKESHLITRTFNNELLARIETNKSTAVAGNLVEDVTIVAGDYTITGSTFWKGIGAADTIAIFDALADKCGLSPNYYILSGSAFRVPYDQAANHAQNDNERSYWEAFMGRFISFDTKNFDSVIGNDAVYLIDPSALFAMFYAEYPEVATPVGDADNTMKFSIPMSFYNGVQSGGTGSTQLSFVNNNALEGARIDIRHQKVCNVAGHYGKTSLDHKFELDVIALIGFIPAEGDNTGIVRVNRA